MVLVVIVFLQVFPSLRGLWVWVGNDSIACIGGRWGVYVGAIIIVCWGWYVWCFWVYINGQVCVGIYEVRCSRMVGKWGWILVGVFLDKMGIVGGH